MALTAENINIQNPKYRIVNTLFYVDAKFYRGHKLNFERIRNENEAEKNKQKSGAYILNTVTNFLDPFSIIDSWIRLGTRPSGMKSIA